MKHLLLICLIVMAGVATAQPAWTWTELDTMPKRVGNNAVVEATVNGVPHVYSFSGIDSTKLYSGIHLESFRYNTQSGVWETIAPLPDTLGKIAAGASVVNNIIYIIGGYHVFQGGGEVSSNKVHRYDPETNSYLSDGTPIPVPIDDQVQAVWRDSLIFVVTGWSNNTNVPNVQIYNPYTDTWAAGTPTTNNNNYKAFGASGMIVGDTIYYNGGAALGFNFPARAHLRKGVIDPQDPTQISWDIPSDNPGDAGYRMAAAVHGNRVFWIGGSGVTYNYDGIAYNGSGGVDPLARILSYDTQSQTWDEGLGAPYQVMDLRGAARIAPTQYIICGGMLPGQVVSNKTFLLEFDPIIMGVNELAPEQQLTVFPNPTATTVNWKCAPGATVRIFDALGKEVWSGSKVQSLDVSSWPVGNYYIAIKHNVRVGQFTVVR